MGYQLWVSTITGIRRRGTRFDDLKKIFIDNVTAKNIYEPLLCCYIDSESQEVKNDLQKREFDVAGVKEKNDRKVIGYVIRDEIKTGPIKKYLKIISHDLLISDSTPLAEIFSLLSKNDFTFIIYGNNIKGIITKADINKPPVRIYIFGIISLLEMHLNFWINFYFKDNCWIKEIQIDRVNNARRLYEERKGNNQDLTLLECMQLCDKRDLLLKSDSFLKKFKFTNNKFETLLKRIEKLRNDLVHSQNSIITNLGWNKFVDIITIAEKFLINSDIEVECLAKAGTEYRDLLI